MDGSGPTLLDRSARSDRTPLVELTRYAPAGWRVFLKLEFLNTTGSNKDRSGYAMVEDAIRSRRLRAGMSVVEASSGNASVAIAAAAAPHGCSMTALVPPGMARDKLERQRGYGILIQEASDANGRSDAGYRRQLAKTMASEHPDQYCTLDQFANPVNPRSHEQGTGAECVRQLQAVRPSIGTLGWFIMGVGTGGTITGVSRALRDAGSMTDGARIVAVDPNGSAIGPTLRGEQVDPNGRLEAPDGIGAVECPVNLDRTLIDQAVTLPRAEALVQLGRLRRMEGLLAGPCTGFSLAVLHRIAQLSDDELGDRPRTALLIASDRGEPYLADPAVRAAVA
jgi:cysteine synthase